MSAARMFAARVATRVAARPVVASVARRSFANYFATSHEYVKLDGDVATIGITAHAADALGDIVFVDLPDVGDDARRSAPPHDDGSSAFEKPRIKKTRPRKRADTRVRIHSS